MSSPLPISTWPGSAQTLLAQLAADPKQAWLLSQEQQQELKQRQQAGDLTFCPAPLFHLSAGPELTFFYREFGWQIQPARTDLIQQKRQDEFLQQWQQGLVQGLEPQDAVLWAAQAWEVFPQQLTPAQRLDLCRSQARHWQDPDGLDFKPSSGLGLYPVMPSAELVADCLAAGLHTCQLRLKQAPSDSGRQQIQAAIDLGKKHQAQVFINDDWQLALELGAFGVHLGQEDLLQADLRAIKEAGLALGLSSHGYAELLRAAAIGPSYLALGHIFATQTKDMPSQPQGLARLGDLLAMAQHLAVPCLAIGGIKQQHFQALADLGLDSVALVSAISQATAPEQEAKALGQAWQQALQQAPSGNQPSRQ